MRLLYVSPCAWACTLYVYMYGAWRGGLSDAPIVRKARVLGRAHCTCTCTVFGVDSLSDAPIVRRCVDVGLHTVLLLV